MGYVVLARRPLMKPSEPIFAILEPLISLAVISCDSSMALEAFRNQPCLLNRRTLIVRDPVLLCAHHS